jgi:hypothetical protein
MAENQFILEASFCAVSDILMDGNKDDFSQWLSLSLVDKVLQFTSLLQHMRKDIRLGGLVGIYQLVKEQIEKGIREDVQNVVLEEIFLTLEDADQQESVFLAAALEIIGLFGPNERSHGKINIIQQLICDRNFSSIHINGICCLLQLGSLGLRALVELATKDFNGLSQYILCNLIQVRAIQRVILVPSILSQLNS